MGRGWDGTGLPGGCSCGKDPAAGRERDPRTPWEAAAEAFLHPPPKEGEHSPAGLGTKKRFITVSATQHFTPPFSQSQHCYYSNPPVCLRLPFVLLPPHLLPGPGTRSEADTHRVCACKSSLCPQPSSCSCLGMEPCGIGKQGSIPANSGSPAMWEEAPVLGDRGQLD